MDKGNVLHASHEDVHVLRFIGDIRYPLSPSIDRFLDGIFAGPEPAGFVIDLTETDSIDSTNLGLLARIARRMQSLDARRVTIVSNRADITSCEAPVSRSVCSTMSKTSSSAMLVSTEVSVVRATAAKGGRST